MIGAAANSGFVWRRGKNRGSDKRSPEADLRAMLLAMDDALQAVSLEALQTRGEWDRAEFDAVLHQIETLTPDFQAALVDYISGGADHQRATISALLAVDRLSAAYTYWTRLFPPRQSDETMFVLSLLHDLGEKVISALDQLDGAG